MSFIYSLDRSFKSEGPYLTCYTSEEDCRKAADAYLDSIGAPRLPIMLHYDAGVTGRYKHWNAAGTGVYIEVTKRMIYPVALATYDREFRGQ